MLASTDKWIWILNRSPYWKYHTMLVPKRHIDKMSSLDVIETAELFRIYEIAVRALDQLQKSFPEGEGALKYIFFWRYRHPGSNALSDQRKISHFHLHIAPDRDHLFDPLLDSSAFEADYIPLLNIAQDLEKGGTLKSW